MLALLTVWLLAQQETELNDGQVTDDWHGRLLAAADRGLRMSVDDDLLVGNVGFVLRPRLDIPLTPAGWPQMTFQMARPQLRVAALQSRIKMFLQVEVADRVRLLDAEVIVKPWKALGFRAGRYVTPFSRSFYTPVPRLKFPDFTASNVFFRPDRDIGGGVLGELGRVFYEVGAFTGQPTAANPLDRSHYLLLAMVDVAIIGEVPYDENRCTTTGGCGLGFAMGANASYHHYQARAADTADPTSAISLGDAQRTTSGINLAFVAGAFQAQGEVYYRATHAPAQGPRSDAFGGYLHAAYGIIPRFLELAVRADVLDPSWLMANDRLLTFDALVTTYLLSDHAKLWVQYSLRDDASRPAQHTLLLQTQFWL